MPATEVEAAVLSLASDSSKSQETIVQILRPSFPDGKWSVSDGGRKFQVSMEDETFKARIHAREVGFYEGDLYLVQIHTRQTLSGTKLATERIITRVIAPVPLALQTELPIGNGPQPNRRSKKKSN